MAEKTTFIKLDRNILQWRWYKNSNVFRVFLYLLVTAAYKDMEIDGIKLKRGQCLTTYREMAEKHELSYKSIRTVITKLKDTGEISVRRLKYKQIITITNYELYQGWYKFAFFVDLTGGAISFDEKGQSATTKRAISKPSKKQLDKLEKMVCEYDERAITFPEKGNLINENGQSKEESNQRRNLMNNYFYYNKINNNIPPLTREYINYIITIFNDICTDYHRVKALSAPMVEEISRSLEHYSLEDFKEVFIKAEASHCLRGKNKLRRRATFDWLIKAENMAKILNGNYDDPPNENSSFDNDEFLEAALKKSYNNIGGSK